MTDTPGRADTPAEIRGILTTHHLTRVQLSRILRVNRITVQYWLSGRRHPSAAHRAALANLLEPER